MREIVDRNEIIKPYILNKIVLDIGFLGDNAKLGDVSDFHLFLKQYAKDVLGIDIEKRKIDYLKKKGWNVMYDNAENLINLSRLNKKFDVVVIGETLHYLSNVGMFLENIKKFLHNESLLIITLPNPYSLRRIYKYVIKGKFDEPNLTKGSVMYFTKDQIRRLLWKHNFEIVKIKDTTKREYSGIKGNIEKLISRILPRFASHFLVISKVRK